MPCNAFAANRSSGGGTRAQPRRGRRDERFWRDAERALQLGHKYDSFSVEIDGVKFVKSWAATKPPRTPRRNEAAGMRAKRPQAESEGAFHEGLTRAPNSAQRRSATRLQEFLAKKAGPEPAKVAELPASAASEAADETRVESDTRNDGEPMDTTEAVQHGHKRAASESPACAPSPTAAQPQQRQAESTGRGGREGRGLRVDVDARRREHAELAHRRVLESLQ